MAIIKIKRPQLTIAEKLYLPAVIKGLSITLGHAIRAVLGKTPGAKRNFNSSGLGITMQYPETKWDDQLPELKPNQVDSRVEIFGDGSDGGYTAEDWGSASGSINYEIVTRIGPRVPRIYRSSSLTTE